MPWSPREPDPLEERRRKLADQERLVAAQRLRLEEALRKSNEPPPPEEPKPNELPVWRLEDEVQSRRIAEPTPARKRNLARQRRRDMFLFFGLILVLVIVLGLAVYLAFVRNLQPALGT